jgi:hypothetical protein
MRRLVARALGILLATAGLTTLVQAPSQADTECQRTNPVTGLCLITVEVPGNPGEPGTPGDDGPKDTGTGSACWWDGSAQGISKPPPGPVPCSSPDGYWSNGYRCYISLAKPQPPAGDPNWQGHEPGDGAVYNCYQPQTGLLVLIWSADPPPNSGQGPTPRDVAQLAIKQMALRAIDIGITPRPGADSIGIVGMPVWMWAANPDAHTVGPATASATAGGITVSAIARIQRITWDMGDGHTVICNTAGTPYKASYGNKKSPDCGHVYTTSSSSKPDQRFTVTATSGWVITWAGAGQTGTIRLDGLTRSVQIAVGEAQVLVQ